MTRPRFPERISKSRQRQWRCLPFLFFSFLFRNGKQSKAQRAAAGPLPFGLLFRLHTGAAGEFLSTEAPGAPSLDGPRLHDTIEGADGYFLDRGLMEELENSGAKYTPENVMCIVKTPDGMLQWLETGNESSGWMHIERHATDFQRRGVDDPYSFLCEVLQTQPTERGVRPTGPYAIYEIDGKEYTLAYGKNGYIVSFYPSN